MTSSTAGAQSLNQLEAAGNNAMMTDRRPLTATLVLLLLC